MEKKYIFGCHPVLSALTITPKEVCNIYLLQDKKNDQRFSEIISLAKKSHISLVDLSRKEFVQLLGTDANHQGVIAEVIGNRVYNEDYLATIFNQKGDPLFLILDGIQDPHNLGSSIRTACASGVDAVIIPKDKACSLTPTVYKVASGAAGVIPVIQVTNLVRTIKVLQENNVWIYGATEDAKQDIYQVELKRPLALVFGAEGKGLRRLTKENCDFLVKIPMQGIVSSLNVSVAVGVCLFEVVRQQFS